MENFSNPNNVQKITLLLSNAENRAKDMLQRNLEYQKDLIFLEQQSETVIGEAQKNVEASKELWSAAWWLNQKYKILIFGGILLLVVIILIFIFK